MENKNSKNVEQLELFANSIKVLVQNELSTAFNAEIKSYQSFIESYKQIADNSHNAYTAYEKDKLIIPFLSKSKAIYKKLNEDVNQSFNTTESLYLLNAFQNISIRTLELFATSNHDEQSFFYSFIKNMRLEQERKRTLLGRFAIKLFGHFKQNPKLEDKATLNSVLYPAYERCVKQILLENENNLLDIYNQLAIASKNLMDNFISVTTFTQKLELVNYEFDKLDPTDYNVEYDISAVSEFELIRVNFERFTNELSIALENSIVQFDYSILPTKKDKTLPLEELSKPIRKHYHKIEKIKKLWRTTRFALTEDWGLDLEIIALEYQIIQQYIAFVKSLNEKFCIPLHQNIDNYESQFAALNNYFDQDTNQIDKKNIQASLRDFKNRLNKEPLKNSLMGLRNLLNNPNHIEKIDAFENEAETSFSSLSATRRLMEKPDYLREVKPNELESVSPFDLIAFEIKPRFIQTIQAFKRAMIDHTQSLINKLETAPNIALHSVDSASKHYEENEQLEVLIDICRDGLKRSQSKVSETKTINQDFFDNETAKLKESIETLTTSITKIKDNENALQIKLRIVKAIAITHSKEVRYKLSTRLLNLLPILIDKLKHYYKFGQGFSKKISKHLAFDKGSAFISTDTSNFLNTTQLSISKLPYIYQRLFSFEPLESFEMYKERTIPTEALELAYTEWQDDKFAPVVLIGEKGSGKTTFLRKFINSIVSSKKVFEFNLFADKKSSAEYFQNILEVATAEKQNTRENEIIIIDGLERLFESKINGFYYLLELFKIISDTQKDIFWIVSVHNISWEYFDKSIQASDYFAYHIRLNDLTYDELVSLIESKHNLSGYNVVYKEPLKKKRLLGNRVYDEKEKQAIYRKSFFSDLNKSVQGNILQVYIYWLRSAQLSENNTIWIELDNQVDLDFVRNISANKLLVLKSILICNGLDANKLAEFSRLNLAQCELQLKQLDDDGILFQTKEIYYINPLIYKSIIKYLYDINLLH
jgi:hypothetical protein